METLLNLYNIASPSGKEKFMAKFIIEKLKSMDIKYSKDRYGNIYAVKGKSTTYPCIVCHIDEVHERKTGSYNAYVVNDSMIVGYNHKSKKMTGIGADDKNGIWICLKVLEQFPLVKCAFFVKEEIGCIGSSNADMSFFSDSRFVIQCDRKGNSDIITNIGMMDLCSKEFIKAVQPEKFGYKVCSGLTTDVYTLKSRGVGISCINMSCGYYNPHSASEYTIWEDLQRCYEFVCHIVTTCTDVYTHRYTIGSRARRGWLEEDDMSFFGWPGLSRLDYGNTRLKRV